jgi:hypothetical protein
VDTAAQFCSNALTAVLHSSDTQGQLKASTKQVSNRCLHWDFDAAE